MRNPLKGVAFLPSQRASRVASVANSDWTSIVHPSRVDLMVSLEGDSAADVVLSVRPGPRTTIGIGNPGYVDGTTVTIHVPRELSHIGNSEVFVAMEPSAQ